MSVPPKVSVCIPIYNVAPFIEHCARSLFEQTLDDIEFIFVDDKSPDDSVDILLRVLEEYPHRKARTKVIRHETNQGVSGARTTALEAVTGEFVIGCDSDDWVEPDAYEAMYETARETDADMVICDYFVNYADREIYVAQCGEGSGHDVSKLLLSGRLHCALWNKLVKSTIFRDNRLYPEPDVNMWEDVILSVRNAYYSEKVVHLPKAYYHYNQENAGSYTASVLYSDRVVDNLRRVVSVLERFFADRNAAEAFENDLIRLKLNIKRAFLLHTRGARRHELQRLYPETTKFILGQETVPVYYRLALWTANHGLMPLAELIIKIVFAVKRR